MEQARELARRFPRLGRYAAELLIPEGARIERTGDITGHHTVWADADDLVNWVVRVVMVD